MSDSTEAVTRGRPPEYDRELVLDAVVQLFWEKGYEATSVADIVDATGLSKSSLYGGFGTKEELLDQALNRYLTGVFGQLVGALADSDGGLEDVHKFVDLYHHWLLDDAGGRGCLAINAANELGHESDPVSQYAATYRETLRAALGVPLRRAADRGEIEAEQVDLAAEQVIGLCLAASVFSRSRADAGEVRRLAEATHRLVDSWS